MPWKDGQYTQEVKYTNDKIQNKPFTAARLDEGFNDVASGINQTLNINGENSMQAALKMANHKITGLQEGTSATDAATVSQIGTLFAVDQSTDATKIDLVQKPNRSISAYKDGMQISFVVKNNSVNTMQIQLNGLGYKTLSYVGYGSYMIGATRTVVYNAAANSFMPKDADNQTLQSTDIIDFNNVVNNCNVWVNGSNTTGNKPADNVYWGALEVKTLRDGAAVRQIFYAGDGYTYTRIKESNIWSAWYRQINDQDFNQLLALAQSGTNEGAYKFTLRGTP
ncbi:hypothetical protein ACFX5K_01370 [Rickettsiales bacterium LUAb2]